MTFSFNKPGDGDVNWGSLINANFTAIENALPWPAADGGTGVTSYAAGDLLYASGASTLSKLGIGAADELLRSDGAAPQWSTLTSLLDTLSTTQGAVLYRGTSSWAALGPGSAGQVLQSGGAGADPSWATAGGSGPHALLSATHTDTTADTVVRGDLVVGQGASPKWERLTITGSANKVLRSDGTDASWAAVALGSDVTGTLPVANGGTGATTASAARTNLGVAIGSDVQAFSSSLAAIAGLSPTKGKVIVGNGSAWVALGVGTDTHVLTADSAQSAGVKWAAGAGSTHDLLSATHGDTVADSVVRGDLLVGNSTPKWSRLAISGSANKVLRSNGTDAAWAAVALSTDVSGTLPIANGGTGQTTAGAAFDAVSPLTTQGDLIVRNATTNTRLARGSSGQFLGNDGTDVGWKTLSGTSNRISVSADGSGNLTLSGPQDVHTGASPTFAGLTLSSALSIANGGTGQTTASAAFDALSPLTTQGDLIVRNATTNTRLARGSSGQFLGNNGTDLGWKSLTGTSNRVTVSADGSGNLTLTGPQDVHSGAAPTFAGLTLSSPLTVANGGTGLSSLTAGDLPYFSSGTALSKLAIGTSGQVLSSTGSAPTWGAVPLPKGYISGLRLRYTGSNEFECEPGICRSADDSADIVVSNVIKWTNQTWNAALGRDSLRDTQSNTASQSGATVTGSGTTFLSSQIDAGGSKSIVGTLSTGGGSSTTITGTGTRFHHDVQMGSLIGYYNSGNGTGALAYVTTINTDTSLTVASAITIPAGSTPVVIPNGLWVTIGTNNTYVFAITSNTSMTVGHSSTQTDQPVYWGRNPTYGLLSMAYVYVLKGGSGTTLYLSNNPIKPLSMPTGYDEHYRRIGSILLDASANVVGFRQGGDGNLRHLEYPYQGPLTTAVSGNVQPWLYVSEHVQGIKHMFYTSIGSPGGVGSDILVVTPWGSSGYNAFFINTGEDNQGTTQDVNTCRSGAFSFSNNDTSAQTAHYIRGFWETV